MGETKRSEDKIEFCVDPVNDKGLMKNGVKVCGVVHNEKGAFSTYIVFKKGDIIDGTYIDTYNLPIRPKKDGRGWEVTPKTILEGEQRESFKSIDDYYNALNLFINIIVEEGIIESLKSSMSRRFIYRKDSSKDFFEIPKIVESGIIESIGWVASNERKNLSKYALDFISPNTKDQDDFEDLTTSFSPIICSAFDKEDWLELGKIGGGLSNIIISENLKDCRIIDDREVDFKFIKNFKLNAIDLSSVAEKVELPESEIKWLFHKIASYDEQDDIALNLSRVGYLPDVLAMMLFERGDVTISNNILHKYNINYIALRQIFGTDDWVDLIPSLSDRSLVTSLLKLDDNGEIFSNKNFSTSVIDKAIEDVLEELKNREIVKYNDEAMKWEFDSHYTFIDESGKKLTLQYRYLNK